MPREPWPTELAPVSDDLVALARGLVGGVLLVAILLTINIGLPMLRDWLFA